MKFSLITRQYITQSIICCLLLRLVTLVRAAGIVVVTPLSTQCRVIDAHCIYHATIYNSIINSIIQLNHNHVTIYSSINRVRPPPLDHRTRGGHSSRHPVPPSGASCSLPRAASITRQYAAQSTGCRSLGPRCCPSLVVPVPNFVG